MKKFLTLGVIAAALAVSACNTVAGVGRDLSAAGQAVAGAAEDARNEGQSAAPLSSPIAKHMGKERERWHLCTGPAVFAVISLWSL